MEYCELDFLGSADKIDPHFKKLFEEITGHIIINTKTKKKGTQKDTLSWGCYFVGIMIKKTPKFPDSFSFKNKKGLIYLDLKNIN